MLKLFADTIGDSTGVSLSVLVPMVSAVIGGLLWVGKQLSNLRIGQIQTHNQLARAEERNLTINDFVRWGDSLRDTNHKIGLNVPGMNMQQRKQESDSVEE